MPFATLQSLSKADLERQCAASSGDGTKGGVMPFATLQSISRADLERQCAASSGDGAKAYWITSAFSPALIAANA